MREIPGDPSDGPTPAQRPDAASVLVVPSERQRGVGVMVFVIVVMLAMVVIGPSNQTMTFLGLALSAYAVTGSKLAAACREVRLEFDRCRIVVRHTFSLFGKDVAFPLNRFGAIRTSLVEGWHGSSTYMLELLTVDGTRAVLLASGNGKPMKRGVASVDLEPDKIAELRHTLALRLGVTDEGCVGFKPAVPTLSERDGTPP